MSEFTLGQHEAKIDTLTNEVLGLRKDVTTILELLAERRGERRVALWGVGAMSSTITMILGYVGKLLLSHAR